MKFRNSERETIEILTDRSWNERGGLLINNRFDNSFSNLRNFFKRSKGEIRVVISDEYGSVYKFTIDVAGFTDEFNKL